jgi:membrane-bound lytic murein transglycosylase D
MKTHSIAPILSTIAALLLSACQTMPFQAPLQSEPQTPTQKMQRASDGVALTSPLGVSPALQPVQTGTAPSQSDNVGVTLPSLSAGIDPNPLTAQDMWGRLRRGFAVPALHNDLVNVHARRFASSGFVAARADRIRLYLPLIIEELEQRHMPLELALLPMVESALNPQARSPVGALGLWQFMAPTARRFELRTSRLVDDRKNLRHATRAAMDYLEKLYAQFGDWHLAMAAYNWGEGSVGKAVARQRARGLPTDFNALAPLMPDETRNYVPQIMALVRLVGAPQAFAARLPDMPDGNPLVEVAISRDMDLSLAIRMSGMSERDFLALNAAVKAPLVLAAATPSLLLPQDAASRLEAALAAHTGRTASWSVQKLEHTQHVEAIATRLGTNANAVRAANDIPRGMKPVAGSALLLPIAAAAGSQTHAELVASAYLQTTPDIVKVYTQARPRETLADVAQRSAVAVTQLAQWNAIAVKRANQRLSPGKALTLWVQRERASGFLSALPAARKLAPKSDQKVKALAMVTAVRGSPKG